MTKKNTLLTDRISKLTKAIDPDKGKTEVKIEDVVKPKKTGGVLDSLRKVKKPQTHQSVKIRTELYDKLKQIAEAEGIDSHGKLMTAILEDWISKYDAGQV